MQLPSAGRTALVLYGTETGNAQDIAYEISQTLRRLHFAVRSCDLDAISLPALTQADLVIFAVSTTGQGDFPSNARKFWSSLLRKKLTPVSLQDVTYGIIGLCDSSYPKFNLAARKLDKRLRQLGARSIVQPCEADEQREEGTEGEFLAWLPQLQDAVLQTFPLGDGHEVVPPTEKLPGEWVLTEVGQTTAAGSTVNGVKNGRVKYAAGFPVVLEANDRLTPKDHFQDVRFLRLRSETAFQYMPGDAIGIRPENPKEEVEQLLDILEWTLDADKTLAISPRTPGVNDLVTPDPIFQPHCTYTLRQLLTCYLDINAIPRRSFFAKIAHFTTDEMQRDRALEFADPQYLDEYFDYATRPRRSILEVLQEFNAVKIPWQEAIDLFPTIRPRQFSIASGGVNKEDGHMFELLVAIVKYKTVIKRIREGICTKYIARLPVGTKLNVTLHTEGRLHSGESEFDNAHCLIGAGTGLAPLRSVVQEKLQIVGSLEHTTLIFGCRSRKADYFFAQELADMVENDGLQLFVAFSRDQDKRVYIQDRIRQEGRLMRDLLINFDTTFLVCGSSGAMPKAVRQALADTLADAEGAINLDQDEAEETLNMIEKEGRYKQETW